VFHAHNALKDRLVGHRPDAIDHAFRVGASGVHIFFVISGFVMVYTTWRSRLTPGKFLSRRLIRIYPIYWIMAGTYLIAHALLGTPYDLGASQVAAAALLLPGASSLVIGPGWTLSFEMYFYICFAVALLAGLRRGLLILSVYYLLSTVADHFLAPQSSIGHVTSDSLLLEFAGGAWLGYAFAHGWAVRPRTGAALVLLALILFASGFWLDYERLPSVVSWGVPSFLLVTGALAFEPWFRTAAGHALAKLGDSSYLLYLSHILVIDLMITTPIRSWNSSVSAAVWLTVPMAAICTIAAAIGYEVVELPLLKVLKMWLLPRRNPPAQASIATQ
jgi:exopolysaccharide production protein ExoZ